MHHHTILSWFLFISFLLDHFHIYVPMTDYFLIMAKFGYRRSDICGLQQTFCQHLIRLDSKQTWSRHLRPICGHIMALLHVGHFYEIRVFIPSFFSILAFWWVHSSSIQCATWFHIQYLFTFSCKPRPNLINQGSPHETNFSLVRRFTLNCLTLLLNGI